MFAPSRFSWTISCHFLDTSYKALPCVIRLHRPNRSEIHTTSTSVFVDRGQDQASGTMQREESFTPFTGGTGTHILREVVPLARSLRHSTVAIRSTDPGHCLHRIQDRILRAAKRISLIVQVEVTDLIRIECCGNTSSRGTTKMSNCNAAGERGCPESGLTPLPSSRSRVHTLLMDIPSSSSSSLIALSKLKASPCLHCVFWTDAVHLYLLV